MEIVWLILGAIVLALVLPLVIVQSKGFDDPKGMTNHQLLSAIAGQADWIKKMHQAPAETQFSKSIIELTFKRKNYIAQLCREVVSRDCAEGQIFFEVAQYAKELESSGVPPDKAVVRAVKEKLFNANGVVYSASWEI